MQSGVISYLGFVLSSVKREFLLRFQNNILGITWLFAQPLATITVYTLIFSSLMGSRLSGSASVYSYAIYLCCGTIAWGHFVETITRSSNVFIENANMIKKLKFPRICLPIIVSISSLLNFTIVFFLFLVILLAIGEAPGLRIFLVLPLLLIQIAFAFFLGLLIGTLNVFFRDVGPLTQIIMQFWFWLTPIVYPMSAVPPLAQKFLLWNPMAPIIGGYQDIFVNDKSINFSSIAYPIIITLLLMVYSIYIFARNSREMSDEL